MSSSGWSVASRRRVGTTVWLEFSARKTSRPPRTRRGARSPDLEVEMVVIAAPGIELLTAACAPRSTVHVFLNRQLRATGSAENCLLIPFDLRPDPNRVIGERRVAVFACVVNATALHLDRDNVSRPMIVGAPGLRIQVEAAHLRNLRRHGASWKRELSRASATPHRSRQSRGRDLQSESPESSAAF